jgi:capsular polysaccharide biosynthesis protein
MSLRDFFQILTQRWFVIVVVFALAGIGAFAYSKHQKPIYQATATIFAHPAAAITNSSDYTSDLNLLSYGALSQTFAALAQSRSTRVEAARSLGLKPEIVDEYSASASLLPSTTVIEVSVQGPDPGVVVKLANQLASQVAIATMHYFRIFALTPLDSALSPGTQVQPQTSRNLLYGGIAGLIIGFILAALSLALPDLLAAEEAQGGPGSGGERPWFNSTLLKRVTTPAPDAQREDPPDPQLRGKHTPDPRGPRF